LVLRHLNDPDAEVRAHLLVQLRPRKAPGALAKLIAMADSPEPVVREALRRALPEFTVGNFLANFDEMDDAARSTAGLLVRKIDCGIADRLRAEMQVLSPVRRRRAVLAAQAMGAVGDVEDAIAQLLSDEDHMVRIAAASALGEGKSVVSWEALRDALLDRSYLVKEAAEKSLEAISAALRHVASSGAQLQEVSP
jgi:HEAT repeat protein